MSLDGSTGGGAVGNAPGGGYNPGSVQREPNVVPYAFLSPTQSTICFLSRFLIIGFFHI